MFFLLTLLVMVDTRENLQNELIEPDHTCECRVSVGHWTHLPS